MNDLPAPPAPAAPPAGRERGWWRVAVAIALFLFVPLTPLLRILLPVDQTVVLLAPTLAACAVVGWWAGGRLPLAVLWTALAAWVLWRFTAGDGTLAYLACGWAVLLAAAFGGFAVLHRRDAERPFLPRALASVAVALLLAGGVAVVVPDGPQAVRQGVRVEVGARAENAISAWRQLTHSKDWRDLVARRPAADSLALEVERQLQLTPGIAVVLFPAMLALESLAALGLAWAIYHRVGRARLGPPLGPLREFRFNDQLVWGVIVGLVMVVVPPFAQFRAVGQNLLVFFGALYALRGVGVVLWFLAPGRLVLALLIGFAVLFWHVLGLFALGLGLGDTWLDWRRRARTKP